MRHSALRTAAAWFFRLRRAGFAQLFLFCKPDVSSACDLARGALRLLKPPSSYPLTRIVHAIMLFEQLRSREDKYMGSRLNSVVLFVIRRWCVNLSTTCAKQAWKNVGDFRVSASPGIGDGMNSAHGVFL